MGQAPWLVGTAAIQSTPGPDDAGQDEDHADEDDEMGGVLAQRDAGDALLIEVRDEIVLDDVEQEPEGHHRDPEPGKARQRRSMGERRERVRIDQSACLRSSLLLTLTILSLAIRSRQVFDQRRHAIE
jgi:hypothetical protein